MRGKWVHDVIRDRLLTRAGLFDRPPPLTLAALEKEIRDTTWDSTFIQYMFNRLLMGRLRYGPKTSTKTKYNYAKSIESKIKLYMETGNTEILVDIGNYAMLEFRFGEHPSRHFSAKDDEDHAQAVVD